MKRIALVLLSTVLLSVNTSAWALFGDDEARKAILELRDQLKSQQEVQMSLYDRLEKLTKEVQTLRGKVEDLTNSVGKEKQNAETIYDDLSNRLNEMDPKAKAAAAASDREISAKQELDRCLSVFQKGDANQAIKCFSGMTQKYSRTKVYPDALYWLGSSYYMKGNFAQTIATEQRLISGYSKHAKVPEAYLLVGMAQMDSKKTAEPRLLSISSSSFIRRAARQDLLKSRCNQSQIDDRGPSGSFLIPQFRDPLGTVAF